MHHYYITVTTVAVSGGLHPPTIYFFFLQLSYHLCLILVCDVLYGKGVRCGGTLKSLILRNIEKLKLAKNRIVKSQSSPISTYP